MTDLLFALTASGVEPEITRPDPEMLVSGDPVHTTWNVEDDRGLYCGIWESTPGVWLMDYTEWEYCRVLSGRAVIDCDDGTSLTVGPGDSFILRPGYKGTWRVEETIRKEYVILDR